MGKQISEFDGTGPGDSGGGSGSSAAIDPASLVPGTGAGAGNGDGGTGSGGDDGDDFERNSDGTVKRNKDGSPRRKRGRKSGDNRGSGFARSPGPSKNKDDLKRSIDALSNILLVSHLGLSGVTNIPEIALEKDDADLLANAAVPVLEQFDFTPDPRFVAVFGLIMACGKVYGPRAYLYRVRKESERAEKAKPVNGFEMPPA